MREVVCYGDNAVVDPFTRKPRNREYLFDAHSALFTQRKRIRVLSRKWAINSKDPLILHYWPIFPSLLFGCAPKRLSRKSPDSDQQICRARDANTHVPNSVNQTYRCLLKNLKTYEWSYFIFENAWVSRNIFHVYIGSSEEFEKKRQNNLENEISKYPKIRRYKNQLINTN